ncbi:hypothetical protein BGZ65_006177 [Modicella reniformis]|uniref:Uncharacterized protein n=1 Tax=Modicella reniformis TaxID=1440133 RepID=A0A9P6MBZ0_9FUNG|nr:hypothetical protein BGZ65_006177 [Modicella reniformis]
MAAFSMTNEHLYQYYRDRIVAERELTVLKNSSDRLADAEQALRSLLQERRKRKPSPISAAPDSPPVLIENRKHNRPEEEGPSSASKRVAAKRTEAPSCSSTPSSRRPSVAHTERPFVIDLSTYRKQIYVVRGQDVGELFCRFQQLSARFVNNLANKANISNLRFFLAVNYIFDLTSPITIPGLREDTLATIKDGCIEEPVELPDDESALCLSLTQELTRAGDVIPRVFQDMPRRQIMLLFQNLVQRLRRKIDPTLMENKDTFVHTTIDPFWSTIFHCDSQYTFGWANEMDRESKARQGDGFKPYGYLEWMGLFLHSGDQVVKTDL